MCFITKSQREDRKSGKEKEKKSILGTVDFGICSPVGGMKQLKAAYSPICFNSVYLSKGVSIKAKVLKNLKFTVFFYW